MHIISHYNKPTPVWKVMMVPTDTGLHDTTPTFQEAILYIDKQIRYFIDFDVRYYARYPNEPVIFEESGFGRITGPFRYRMKDGIVTVESPCEKGTRISTYMVRQIEKPYQPKEKKKSQLRSTYQILWDTGIVSSQFVREMLYS